MRKLHAKGGLVCGVPQGYNLRPLLFILYIINLPNYLRDAKCLLFADDTSIFYQNRNPKIFMDYLNDAIRHVATWLTANKMSINVEKQRSWFLDLNKNN